MCWKIVWCLVVIGASGSRGLICFNCSSTHRDRVSGQCGGDFVSQTINYFNSSVLLLVNCTGGIYNSLFTESWSKPHPWRKEFVPPSPTVENAMCFVRAWSSRAHHSWLVQRGCYQPIENDPLPRSLNIPTRAMACKHERYPEAEYKVCLCKADWCNAGTRVTSLFQSLLVLLTNLVNRTIFA